MCQASQTGLSEYGRAGREGPLSARKDRLRMNLHKQKPPRAVGWQEQAPVAKTPCTAIRQAFLSSKSKELKMNDEPAQTPNAFARTN